MTSVVAAASAGAQNFSSEQPFVPGHVAFPPGRLAEAISLLYYGRKLALVYEGILISMVLIAASVHWYKKLSSAKSSNKKSSSALTSSSNSNNSSNNSEDIIPLLQSQKHTATPYQKLPWYKKLYCQISGRLLRQSPTDPETFDSNVGTLLFIIFYYALSYFFCIYKTTEFPVLFAFRTGLISAINIPLLYIFGTKRSIMPWLMGWSYEQLTLFHMHIGYICCQTFVVHTIAFLYYFRVPYLITHLWSIAGIIAGFSFLCIYITVRPFFRKYFYELFYAVHLFGLIVCLPALWFHHPVTRPFVAVAFLAVLYDRLVRVLQDYRLVYSSVEVQPGDTVVIRIPKTKSQEDEVDDEDEYKNSFLVRFFSGRAPLSWGCGQHVFISVLGCHLFQSHPFTIASHCESSDTMDIIIRARSGFTRDILDQTVQQKLTKRWVLVHGPYGVPLDGLPKTSTDQNTVSEKKPSQKQQQHKQTTTQESTAVANTPTNYSSIEETHPSSLGNFFAQNANNGYKSKVILIAGGAGIAFTLPIYEKYRHAKLAKSKDQSNVLLSEESDLLKTVSTSSVRHASSSSSSSSSSSTPRPSIDTNEDDLISSDPEVKMMWVVPQRNFIEWLPPKFIHDHSYLTLPLQEGVNACSGNYYDDNDFKLWVTAERRGRPDIKAQILSMMDSGRMEYNATGSDEKDGCWVGVCGPTPLVIQVRNAVAELRSEGHYNLRFYAEVFGW